MAKGSVVSVSKRPASEHQRKGGTKRTAKAKTTPKLSKSFSHGILVTNSRAKQSRKPPTKASLSQTASPFLGFSRPSVNDIEKLHSELAKHFGARKPSAGRPRREILDTIVGTILSQNTTNTNSARAFSQLTAKFKTWDKVRLATAADVAEAIKCGGLAPKKTVFIQRILDTIYREQGKTSMEYLRHLSKEEVHADLERFTGIGKKTSAIISMFDVGHPDMAVDTHVFRYAEQLGWVPSETERDLHNKNADGKRWPKVTRDSAYAHLDATFPDALKYSMHLILTDTVGGLPVVCGARNELSFNNGIIRVDGGHLVNSAVGRGSR